MNVRETITRREAIDQINRIFDEVENGEGDIGEYRIFFVIESLATRPDILSLQRGWPNKAICREVINTVFSLGDILESW